MTEDDNKKIIEALLECSVRGLVHFVDENKMADLKELFKALDKTQNDKISYDEIMQLDYASGGARATPTSKILSTKNKKNSNSV